MAAHAAEEATTANGARLLNAVEHRDTEALRGLLAQGAEWSVCRVPGGYGKTLLHVAAEHGELQICRLLLDAGADPNARVLLPTDRLDVLDHPMPTNTTPLHVAAANGSAEVCALLLERGADVVFADGLRSTALHLAAAAGSWAACDVLIRAGALVDALDVGQQRPLHCAAAAGDAKVCLLLLNAGAQVSSGDLGGASPLHVAALNHRSDACGTLLDAGGIPNQTDEVGSTPLHNASSLIAFLQGSPPAAVATLNVLLRAGADPLTPLPFGSITVAELLQPYPQARVAYATLLAEIRGEVLDTSLAEAPSAIAGRGHVRL